MKKKKPLEFSKKIIIGISAYLATLNLFTFFAVLTTGDLSPLAYLIPGGFSIGATCFGFYFWKAKAENRIKLNKANKIPMNEPDDIFKDGKENNYDYFAESEGTENG